MATPQQVKNIDMILTYLLLKKLTQPIVQSKAYKEGLVDASGSVLREPRSPIEEMAMTLLDKVVFQLKRLLGPRVIKLNKFLYLQTLNNNFYNKLVVRGTIDQRAEILRIIKDMKTIQEKYNIEDIDTLMYSLLSEVMEDFDADKQLC